MTQSHSGWLMLVCAVVINRSQNSASAAAAAAVDDCEQIGIALSSDDFTGGTVNHRLVSLCQAGRRMTQLVRLFTTHAFVARLTHYMTLHSIDLSSVVNLLYNGGGIVGLRSLKSFQKVGIFRQSRVYMAAQNSSFASEFLQNSRLPAPPKVCILEENLATGDGSVFRGRGLPVRSRRHCINMI